MFALISLWPLQIAKAQAIFDGDKYRQRNDPLRDNRLIGVDEKPPELSMRTGLRLGSFNLLPRAEIETVFDSNLLAIDRGQEDMVQRVGSRFDLRHDVSSSELAISASANQHWHLRRALEDSTELEASIHYTRPLAQYISFETSAGIGRSTERRTDSFTQRNSLRPIRFSRSQGSVFLTKNGGRLLLRTGLVATRLDYRNAVSRDDGTTIIREDQRSRIEIRPTVQSEYAFSPDQKIFAEIDFNDRNHFRDNRLDGPLDGRSRSSRGFEMRGGLRFKPTPLIEVSAALGYLEQYYRSPLSDISGWSGAVEMKWLPTRLTTVRAHYSRNLEDGGSQISGSVFVDRGKLSVHHELRRDMLLSISADMEGLDYTNSVRVDRRYRMAAGARYRSNRNLTISGNVQWLKQESDGAVASRNFSQLRLSLALSLAVR